MSSCIFSGVHFKNKDYIYIRYHYNKCLLRPRKKNNLY